MCLFSVKRNHRIISTPRVYLSIYLSIYLPCCNFHVACRTTTRLQPRIWSPHYLPCCKFHLARDDVTLRKAASVPHGELSRRTGCRPA